MALKELMSGIREVRRHKQLRDLYDELCARPNTRNNHIATNLTFDVVGAVGHCPLRCHVYFGFPLPPRAAAGTLVAEQFW